MWLIDHWQYVTLGIFVVGVAWVLIWDENKDRHDIW